MHVKKRIPPEMQKGTVYQIKCESGKSYIGESGCQKSTRIKKNIADVKHGRTDTSATAQHVYSCDKDIKISEAKLWQLKETGKGERFVKH